MLNGFYEFENIVPSIFHIVERYCDANWYVPPLLRDFHNFMLVMEGSGVALTDGKEYPMLPGMLVYHHPGQTFGFKTNMPDFMHAFAMNFYLAQASCTIGHWNLEPLNKLPIANFTVLQDPVPVIRHFQKLHDVYMEAKSGYKTELSQVFYQLLQELKAQNVFVSAAFMKDNRFEKIIAFMKQNYRSRITLSTLAELTGLNPNYLSSCMKKHTGLTPMEYLNRIRVDKAKEYLIRGHSVQETASLTGFNDPFYFSRTFKRLTGVSPSEYGRSPYNMY